MLVVKNDLDMYLSAISALTHNIQAHRWYFWWILDPGFLGLLLGVDNLLNVALTVAPAKSSPNVVALLDRLSGFVLDIRRHFEA